MNKETGDNVIFESVNSLKKLYRQTKDSRVEVSDNKISYEAVMDLLDVIDLDLSMLCYLLGISGDDLKEINGGRQFTNEQCIKS